MSPSDPTLPPQASAETAIPGQPSEETVDAATQSTPGFGWTHYAERINGRFAMVGFFALLILELWTGEGFFHWLGW